MLMNGDRSVTTCSGDRQGRARRAASGALLVGRLFDDRGNRMTPSTAKRASIRYRYYVSAVLAQGRQSEAGSVARASANKVEALVLEALRAAHELKHDGIRLLARKDGDHVRLWSRY